MLGSSRRGGYRSLSNDRLAYLLVPDSPNVGRPTIDSNGSTKAPLRPSWRQVNSLLLDLSKKFTPDAPRLLRRPNFAPRDQSSSNFTWINTPVSAIKTSVGLNAPPRPPGPEDCCMSGCVTCVWDIYAKHSEDYLDSLKQTANLRLNGNDFRDSPDLDSSISPDEIDQQATVNNSLRVFSEFEKKRKLKAPDRPEPGASKPQ